DRFVGPDRGDDQVAVPPLELFQHRQQLVPLRPALGATEALVRLAPGELEDGDRLLGTRTRLVPALADAGEDRLRRVDRIELRVEIHGAGDAEQLLAPLLRGRVEETLGAVEPTAGDTRDR